eukprot:jgi/Chrzof1/8987/Cz03g31290.t1
MTGLRTLDLSACYGISDLRPLQNLTGLETLNLSGCKGISDLHPLQHLTGLRRLNLSGCGGIIHVHPLQHLTGLETLDIRRPSQDDIASLPPTISVCKVLIVSRRTSKLCVVSWGIPLPPLHVNRTRA